MGFINEEISKEDKIKYCIDKVYEKYRLYDGMYPYDWTVDKERGMYLRQVTTRGREEYNVKPTWSFLWGGGLVIFKVEILFSDKGRGGHKRSKKRIFDLTIPDSIKAHKEQIYSDLKEAFLVYKDGGTGATAETFELTMEIDES